MYVLYSYFLRNNEYRKIWIPNNIEKSIKIFKVYYITYPSRVFKQKTIKKERRILMPSPHSTARLSTCLIARVAKSRERICRLISGGYVHRMRRISSVCSALWTEGFLGRGRRSARQHRFNAVTTISYSRRVVRWIPNRATRHPSAQLARALTRILFPWSRFKRTLNRFFSPGENAFCKPALQIVSWNLAIACPQCRHHLFWSLTRPFSSQRSVLTDIPSAEESIFAAGPLPNVSFAPLDNCDY